MTKDPVCGMDVEEQGARHMLHFEHETIYFCSAGCKEQYAEQAGLQEPASHKGLIGRFLEKLAAGNRSSYGDKPPRCH